MNTNVDISIYPVMNKVTQDRQLNIMNEVFAIREISSDFRQKLNDKDAKDFYQKLIGYNVNYDFKKDFHFAQLSNSTGTRVYYTIEKVCFYFTDGILDSMNKINEIYVLLFLISEIYQMNAFDKEHFAFLNFYILTEKETNRLFLNCDDGNGKILVSYALDKESELQGLDLLIGLNFHFYMQYGVLMLAQEY